MKKGGRPSKITELTIGKLEEAFSLGSTVKEACFYAGIHPDTYYNWISKNEEFSDRFKCLRDVPILRARITIVNALKSDPYLAFKYLERKQKDEFGR